MKIKMIFVVASGFIFFNSNGLEISGELEIRKSASVSALPNLSDVCRQNTRISTSDPANIAPNSSQNGIRKKNAFEHFPKELQVSISVFVKEHADLVCDAPDDVAPHIFESSFVESGRDNFFFNSEIDLLKERVGIPDCEDFRAIRIFRNMVKRHFQEGSKAKESSWRVGGINFRDYERAKTLK